MENEKKSSCCVSDLRIFAIAFLTAIITIALYHLGLSYCRTICRARRLPQPPPARMLVCAPAPQFGEPGCCCCRMGKPFPGRPGDPRMMRDGKGPMQRKFFKRHQMKDKKAPECAPKAPEAPKAEAPKAEAPKAEAPAPAPEKK